MNVSTSVNCFFDDTFSVSVAVQIQRLYDAGFRTLDMNFWDWCHSPASPFTGDHWRDWVLGIRETADRLGIRFTQAHAHVYNFYRESDAADKYDLYKRCLHGASMLDIPWVVFHPSQLPDYDRPDATERLIRDNIRYFRPLVDLAESLGTGIALENMPAPRHGLTDAESLARLIDGFASASVGACWDTGHAHIAGVSQSGGIRALGPRLHALHVQDNDGTSDQHLSPHLGTIDWPPLMNALYEIEYDGDFTFEAHTLIRRMPEGARADAARLLYQIGYNLTKG